MASYINTLAGKFKRLQEHNPLFSKYGNATMAILGSVLGIGFGFGAGLAIFSETLWPMGWYLMFLCFFHLSEFACVAVFNPKLLSAESFLINHSREFNFAMAASFIEYFVELWFFPGLKSMSFISFLGVVGTLAGQAARLGGLISAGHNFTHEIAETKREGHALVTTGIYQYVRHPGYFGWFWWSIFTQVVLVNPICIAGFAFASFKFFEARISYEEHTLTEFFGKQYAEYRARTPTYIPGIH